MTIHSHNFVETYEGLVGFGADRGTDENTVIYYLQKFSDDSLMNTIIKRLSDEELNEIFGLMTRLLKNHLEDAEYHQIFLKEQP
jgi:peptide methionine sulfoxide reductase MsrA